MLAAGKYGLRRSEEPVAEQIQDEQGWLPDYLFCDGRFETGVAMFADRAGRITRFSRQPEDLAQAQRLANRAVLPGLINVHSHAFQRAIRARTEHRTAASHDTFWTWREAMYHAATRLSPEDIRDVSKMAFLEMLLAGITTVGEFHYLHHNSDGAPYDNPNLLGEFVVEAAAEVGIRIGLLRTAYVRAGWKKDPNPGQARFITPRAFDFIDHTDALRSFVQRCFPKDQAWVGVAPHSVRAVPLDYLNALTSYAQDQDLVMHMHVSEQPAENEACVLEHGVTPMTLLHRQGVLRSRFTGIHCIHITDEEIGFIAADGATVGACPTTERNLGDGIGPVDRLLKAGVGVCYGTDSNIQINLFEDARQLEYHLRLKHLERAVLAPDHAHESLSRRLLAESNKCAAQSINAPGGSLEVGRPADFISLDLNDPSIRGADSDSLLANIVFSLERSAVRDVYVGGRRVVHDGRHLREESIGRAFAAAQRKLWSGA
jgi:formimidoylglutamate deiminase